MQNNPIMTEHAYRVCSVYKSNDNTVAECDVIRYLKGDDDLSLINSYCNGLVDCERTYCIQDDMRDLRLIDLSCYFGSYKCFKFLIKNGFSIDENCAKYALCGGNPNVIELIFDFGVDVSRYINYAVRFHHNSIVTWIVDNFEDVEIDSTYCILYDNMFALKQCIENNHNLEKKDEYGRTALIISSEKGLLDVVKLLISSGSDIEAVDQIGNNSIVYAAKNGHLEVVRYLIENNCDPNAVNILGETAIHYASINNHPKIVSLLLEMSSVGINARTNFGETPLFYSAMTNSIDAFRYLLEHEADIEIENYQGVSPLFLAVLNKSIKILNELIHHRAKVDIVGADGMTPLHLAARSGMLDIVETLVMNGAKFSRDSNNETPIDYALQEHNYEVADFISNIYMSKV